MALKIRIPKRKPASAQRPPTAPHYFSFSDPAVKIALAVFMAFGIVFGSIFAMYWVRYDRIVEHRINAGLFKRSSRIYARPTEIWVGEKVSAEDISGTLRRAGYNETDSSVGTYRMLTGGIEIKPGPESFHSRDGAVIRIAEGKVQKIVGTGAAEGSSVDAYELEPELITALGSQERAKRQLLRYEDIPKVLINAVLSIEDRRFFEHSGINYLRFLQAAWVDLREGGAKRQGGSTITMQVSRMFFLTPEKTIKRKMVEMLISVELEQKLSKQQIFEMYANQVDMGQRGSYTTVGFGEAAHAYFNKDVQSLSLPEAALMAGLIQRPSYLNPYRHPERALERRNLVLDAMVETGAINREQAEMAKAAPLKLAPLNVEASDAPYFVDLVKDTISGHLGDQSVDEALRIYTTLDPDLQRAAAEAVQIGIKSVDEQVTKMRTRRVRVGKGKQAKTEVKVTPGPQAQVALVAIDPHTGEVLALVGGRNYGWSQLNHALSRRPVGSVFKPFVYAAALNTALDGDPQNSLTPASLIDDSPTTFTYGDQIYEPRNYKDEYFGTVTARFALAHSLNNATVKLAEQVGYEKVAALAKSAGLTSVKATPAMALGAYEATPVDVAGAYTVFANDGVRISPITVTSVRDAGGNLLTNFKTEKAQVLDPRISYVMTSMMEAVINNGTAAGVRDMGFTAPAAGKTGTSHDGWFAGYTSNLLCIVWVGFDDYSDLRLSGATTAAPVWAEFMKRAIKIPEYREVKEFQQPSGVVDVQLDKTTNLIATAACPDAYTEAFVAGTEPTQTCDQLGHRGILSRIFGFGQPQPLPPPTPGLPPGKSGSTPSAATAQTGQPTDQQKKKGIFGKIFGVFKGDDTSKDKKPQEQQ